jgi:hypothetical protein
MEISINGHKANITLDNEKTIGEIMAGIELWLADSGHTLSGLSIDGQAPGASRLDEVFSREIGGVKTLDVFTSSIAELTVISLSEVNGDIDEYENMNFEDKSNFFNIWKERTHARFIEDKLPELFSLYANAFSSGGLSPETLRSITEERLREVKEPLDEFKKIEPLLNEICLRLVDLPLDIQTGKDGRASQTIQVFSGLTEKILRISKQLNIQGYFTGDENFFSNMINDFSEVLKELLDAYEKRDTVLIGDLAEYEASPKLKELYAAILKKSRETADAQGEK